ncbi:hypothetical protein PV325_011906 [Microctonus aethiopoides]|nr:hypothetical protein PV325_011906 [Microctonus aethiopoides]KAK0074752.1 hypothetical protein PV326_012195 [Microctonus aethiopoides]
MEKAEIEITALIATHNIPISAVDDIVSLFNRLSLTEGTPVKVALSRKKCFNIIKNVLVDKSTTTAGEKLLWILVKYVVPNRELITELFELVHLDATDCSASKLYEAFESSFKKRNVPLTNIVAIPSDNASVMIFCTLLEHIFLAIPKRSAQIKELQRFYNVPESKILKVAESIEHKTRIPTDIYNAPFKVAEF